MSHPASSRKQQPRGRRAIGLFAAVWLNLALAPCAMAIDTRDDHHDDHECPHCPPAEMQGHHDRHAGMHADSSCADGLSDCELDDTFSHDARSGQLQLKDAPYELPACTVASDIVGSQPVSVRQRAPPPHQHDRHPAGPPIHLLNCVFLD